MLDILEQSNQPIAAEDLFFELKKRDESANLSTVYRTLEILVENNFVTKLNISLDSRALFEINRMVHRHYLICLGCKKIIPINHCPLEEYEKSLAEQTNYDISGHKLDIYGYCPVCRLKEKS